MARRALSPAQLAVVQAVAAAGLGADVRVGLSGGADSWALTAAVAHLEIPARVVVVDHGLQEGSDALAHRVADRARGLGLTAEVVRVEVSPAGEGLEAAARTARLEALCASGGVLLLGHTLDDQAEQVLLGLARGSGAGSLQGMAERSSWGGAQIVRPLLGLRRHVLRQACADWEIEVWDDPMNTDPRFLRVRVRTDVMPLLDQVLGPRVPEALARTAEMLREDQQVLDELSHAALARCRAGDGLDCRTLAGLPRAIRTRVLRSWLVQQEVREPSRAQVLAVDELITAWHGQRGVDLPGGLRVARAKGALVIAPVPGG